MIAPGTELVLASGNRGKLTELARALEPLGLKLRPISDWTDVSPEETGARFVDNALIKARHAARLSGRPSLADDSGLEVAALGGAPGVHSARYAGRQGDDAANNGKLLAALEGAPEAERGARFCCVIALVRTADDPDPLIAEGQWQGRILTAPRGTGGFGYDPLFFDPEIDRSAAELVPEDKLARSHRGRAIAALIDQLRR